MFPEKEKITVSVRDCEHRLKTVSNLDEDKMISLLNFSRYYDKLELPIPRNRDKVLEDFSNAGAPLVAIERIVDSVPVSRNENIAEFMHKCGICEERGSGYDKIVEITGKNELLAPRIENQNNQFTKAVYLQKCHLI